MGFDDSTQAPDDFQELGGPVQHQNILGDNQEGMCYLYVLFAYLALRWKDWVIISK